MAEKKLTQKQEMFCQAYVRLENLAKAKELSGILLDSCYGNAYYVYLLVNPINKKIFYVGKGKGKRAENHLKENRRSKLSNGDKHSVINKIIEAGLVPEIIVFAKELTENEALDLEKELINRLKPLLTNKSKGSNSKAVRQQAWAESQLRKILPYDVWVRQRERSDFEKEMYKEVYEMITDIKDGNLVVYDTITVISKNGKQTVKLS